MKTPITTIRLPLELKEKAKKQAALDGYIDNQGNARLSPWLFQLIEDYLEICKKVTS